MIFDRLKVCVCGISVTVVPGVFYADLRADGMLLPPLCTQSDYVAFAEQAGLSVSSEPFDISKNVAKTWYVSCAFSSHTPNLAFHVPHINRISTSTSHFHFYSTLLYRY